MWSAQTSSAADTLDQSRSAEPVQAHGFGTWRALVSDLSRGVDRDHVFAAICEDGGANPRYVMMSVLSAAIATLGLLLSSPAVVIGAMLLSPLMGPIILLGFSFWTIDWAATKRALISLGIGFGLALGVAVLLTWLSPLKEPTAEILARTRPTLFDLLVAAFSGIAGGYAVIRQRGETVIGVAIATALMPPIATIGFGLGTMDWVVTRGALLLFATNLIAIALAAAAMAALHGFRPHYHLRNHGWIGHGAVIAVLIALCVPLTLSLNTIAVEGRANADVRSAVREIFGDQARITSLTVHHLDGTLQVDGLVATPKFIPSASPQIERQLQSVFGIPGRVRLDQVVLADPARLASAAAAKAAATSDTQSAQALRDGVPFPDAEIAYDPMSHEGLVLLDGASKLDLEAALALEQGLRKRQGLERTKVIPPLQPLQAVPVTFDKDGVPAFGAELQTDAWALGRWRVDRVSGLLCGRRAALRPSLTEALATALAPLAVDLKRGAAGDCRSDTPEPYLLIRPG